MPFILIAIAIAALVTAIVVLIKNWDKVKQKTQQVRDAIKSKLSSVWDAIKAKFAAAWDAIQTKLSQTWDKIKSTVQTKGAAVLAWFKALPGKLLALFVRANLWLVSVGENIIRGIIKGIGNGFAWVKAKIVELGGNVLGWAKDILGIGSPSKVMAEQVGKWIPAGIAVGIDSNAGAVRASMAALTSDLSVNARVSARTVGAGVSGPSTAADTTSRRYALTITNWHDGTGYFTEVADGHLSKQIFAAAI